MCSLAALWVGIDYDACLFLEYGNDVCREFRENENICERVQQKDTIFMCSIKGNNIFA